MSYEQQLRAFLQKALDENQLQHFGYLLIPDDKRLNDEAAHNLRKDFTTFVAAADAGKAKPNNGEEAQ